MLQNLDSKRLFIVVDINPLNAELNPICYLLVLLGAHHFLHVSRIRVNVQYEISPLTTFYTFDLILAIPLPNAII
jgi:hypothetical protein